MKKALTVSVMLLLVAGCGRQSPVASPVSGVFMDAEGAFRVGDYQTAVVLYEQLLETESGSVREQAMFRLALIEGLEDAGVVRTGTPSDSYRARLALEYPGSSLNGQFETELAVLTELGDLRVREPVVRSQLEDVRAERERQRSEFERIGAQLARIGRELVRIREERSASEDVVDGTLPAGTAPEVREVQPNPVPSAGDNPDPFDANLARVIEDLDRLIEDYSGEPLALAAESMRDLVSEIRQLRTESATQQDQIEELTLEVQAQSEELEKLREADMRRRLPN